MTRPVAESSSNSFDPVTSAVRRKSAVAWAGSASG